jgi:hypothetical protein
MNSAEPILLFVAGMASATAIVFVAAVLVAVIRRLQSPLGR